MAERKWRVRLGAAAEVDFANILRWTTENFSARKSRAYRDTLVQAIVELSRGPDVAGSRPGVRSWQAFARSTLRGTAAGEAIS